MKGARSNVKHFDVGVGGLGVNGEIRELGLVEEIDKKRGVDGGEASDGRAAVAHLTETIVAPRPKLS